MSPMPRPRQSPVPAGCLAHRRCWPEKWGLGMRPQTLPPSHAVPCPFGVPPHLSPHHQKAWGHLEVSCWVVPLRATSSLALCYPWHGNLTEGKSQGQEPDCSGSNPGSSFYRCVTLGKAGHFSQSPYPLPEASQSTMVRPQSGQNADGHAC